MDIHQLVSTGIRLTILIALIYFLIFDSSNDPKDLTISSDNSNRIGSDVIQVHDDKGILNELGYFTKPQLEFDRTRIYPVVLGMNFLRELKLKEFDHFAFTYGSKIIQMAYT